MRATPVVNHLLRIGFREKADDLTPLKVQKMLYFLHGWYLAIAGESLIDGGFEKWQYGPVSPSVYESLKGYRGQPVNDYIKDWDSEKNAESIFFVNVKSKPQFVEILEAVWEKYSPLTAAQLSTLTHLRDTPWSLTENRAVIDDELIRRHFVEVARAHRASKTATHQ